MAGLNRHSAEPLHTMMKVDSTADSRTSWRFRHVLSACKRFAGRLRTRLTSERGQALLEFAFILPILLVFLLSLVDFGIALDRREVIQHAVREGARQASVGLSDPDITDVVVSQSQDILEADDVTICVADGPGLGGAPAGFAGSAVRVSATYTFGFSLGSGELLGAFGVAPISIEMSPSAEARMETSVTGATSC